MQEMIRKLESLPFTSTLNRDLIEKYIKTRDFKFNFYSKNSMIHNVDDKCSKIEIILSGMVGCERIDTKGNVFLITEYKANDIIGGNIIFSKRPYYPLYFISYKATETLEIEKETLFDLLKSYPSILMHFLSDVSDNTLAISSAIRYRLNITLREKIMNYLTQEYIIQGNACIKMNQSKKKLAEMVGVQRTSLSRELQKMKAEGIIDYNADTITLMSLL